jgi:P27 family predicted phage terminase small subunit
MGSRGPIPKADSHDSKRGRNTRYRKDAGGKTKDEAAKVQPPGYLRGNKAALEFWKRHAPDLIEAKRLQPVHADLFGTICEMAADVRRLTDAVSLEGDLIEGRRGPMANPKVRLLRDARRDLLAAARGFGLDAASDARLPVEERELTHEEKYGPLAAYITPD